MNADAVDALFSKAVEARRRFLRARGWKYRCDYPDSSWRWEKTVFTPGRALDGALALTESEAFQMQRDFLDYEAAGAVEKRNTNGQED